MNESTAKQPTSDRPVLDIPRSIQSLLTLLLTSATFRLILSALFASAQELVASAGRAVEGMAGQLDIGVKEMEKAAGAGYFDDVRETGAFVLEGLSEEAADKLKGEVVKKVQQTLALAHQDPEYTSALRTILTILRKYTDKIQTTTAVEPTIDLDEHFERSLDNLKVLLERSASGTSLDPLLAGLRSFIRHLTTDPPEVNAVLQEFFKDLGGWFDNAINQPEYVTSAESTSSLQDLFTRSQALITDPDVAGPSQDIYNITSLTSSFTTDLSHDRALTRLTNVLDSISVDAKGLRQDALTAPGKWREEFWRDLVEWVVPKVLKVLTGVPIPRVEYMDPNVDLALDSFLLTSANVGVGGAGTSGTASFAPDHVELQNWSEVSLDKDDKTDPPTLTKTSARVHVDGLRASAKTVGYYLRYKGWWGYSDEGILDVSIGGVNTDGLAVDVDLETNSDAWWPSLPLDDAEPDPDRPAFVVTSVHTTIPWLSLDFFKSKHWFLNKLFVRPMLTGSVGKKVLGGIIEGQVKSCLEMLEGMLRRVLRGTEKKVKARVGDRDRDREGHVEGPKWQDYWEALLEEISPSEDVDEDEKEQKSPNLESNVTATLKGIIHTTTSQPKPQTSSSPPSETVLAVGAGAQLFPHKGGPYKEPPAPSAAQVTREAMDEVMEAAEGAVNATKGMVESAVGIRTQMREDVEDAGERFGERESAERRRSGWRSSVFDL